MTERLPRRVCMIVTWLAVLAGCGDGSDVEPGAGGNDPAQPGDAAAYVGSAACANCHSREQALWQGSHHDLALQSARSETVLGDFENARFEYAGIVSTFRRRDEGYFVETDDADGALREFRIVHTFGVYPLQQYLVEYERGRLQALSIAWDARPAADGGQRWFHLYPDEAIRADDPLHWTGVFQNWNTMCASCHSTGVEKRYDVGADSYATTFFEEDVGCEACHGPGSLHVTDPAGHGLEHARVERVWTFAADAPIAVRGGADPPRPETETCAACHARRSQLNDAPPAGGFLDTYRPEFLDRVLYHDDGQIRDEVYVYGSFLQSRMYAAGVTCSDCHEPHSLAVRATGDALCAQCHRGDVYAAESHHHHDMSAAAAGPQPGCVDCHMRAETYMQVDPRRDHSFRVPRPGVAAEVGAPNACNDCHRGQTAAWADARIAEWSGRDADPAAGFATQFAAVRDWQTDPLDALLPLIQDPGNAAIVRATALGLLGDAINGVDTRTLAALAADSSGLVQLAVAEASAALAPDRRAAVSQRLLSDVPAAVRVQAASALLPVAQTLSPGRQADLAAAADAARRAADYGSDRPEGLVMAATLSGLQGDTGSARVSLATAIERFPWFAPAYVNLADLERAAGRNEAALERVDAGIEAVPDNAPLHVARGLALVRLDRLDEAVAALERAFALAPDDPYNRYVLGLGLQAAGQADAATELLRTGAARFPAYGDFWFALATIARDAGDRERAIELARSGRSHAGWDRRFADLLAELGGG